MDFSSIPRALESLNRRSPKLDDRVLEVSNSLLIAKNDASAQDLLDHLTVLLTFNNDDDDNTEQVVGGVRKRRWEHLAVGLYVATEVLQQQLMRLESDKPAGTAGVVYMEGPRVPSIRAGDEESSQVSKQSVLPDTSQQWLFPEFTSDQMLSLCFELHKVCLVHLEHEEPRVRGFVAKATGVYCKVTLLLNHGRDLRNEIHQTVVSSIQEHLTAGRMETEQGSNFSKSSTGALDDTTGWRALETNWQCLAALVSFMGPFYWDDYGYFSQDLLDDLKQSCVSHVNRHVRAAGMAVLEQCIAAAVPSTVHSSALLVDTQAPFRKTIVAVLTEGLADNWSQVRMAASVLCRAFFKALQDIQVDLTPLFPSLLPRMCLNRFYLAQGVKLYNHETWKLVFPEGGITHVAKHLPAICRYYVKMCDANNHVVREAACQAIAELAMRLGENDAYYDQLEQQVDLLLQALLMCFHDESWPVRDEACLACGILCRSYPEKCRTDLESMVQLFRQQMTDQIWSVRENAAVALGDALDAYGIEFYEQKIKVFLKELLPSAKNQPAMSMAEYKARQNDEAAHTDSQLFSCGSLAPKLLKASSRKDGAGRIGCTSCDVSRDRQLWEATDGCIYLVRELVIRCTSTDSVVQLTDQEIKYWLHQTIDVCRVQHFPQADDMRATLWRQVPIMARALGKDRFKRNGYLEIFLDLLFANLESRTASQLLRHAAGQCAEELAQLMGVSIFRGRLEDYQRDTFDQVMLERQSMPKGPAMGDTPFSPFGPPGLLDSVNKSASPERF